MNLEKRILKLLKRKFYNSASTQEQNNIDFCMTTDQIRTELETELNNIVRSLHLLETRGYIKLETYTPGTNLSNNYSITDQGIRSLKLNYKESISFSCIVFGAASATMVLLLNL